MITNSTRTFLRLVLLTSFATISTLLVFGQNTPVSFDNKTNLLPVSVFSGAPIGVADMNGDNKDDIIHLDNKLTFKISFQNGPNQAFTTQNYGQLNGGSEWALCVADVDKNGINDLLAGGNGNSLKLAKGNSSGQFTTTFIGNSNIFVQGTNFSDINNDGWVDIFACSDLSDSRKYKNNGSGSFSMDNSLLNSTSPPSDNSGNYASIWTDYDNDGDLDMYLSKCRQGVSNPIDLRRINKLFNNDGNNVFTDVAASAGLQIGAQTWTTDFADIDNDGDMDAFVNNHGDDCQMFLNNGNGTFSDHTNASGILPTLGAAAGLTGIQAFFRDFNNDGYVDLLYSGEEHFLFYNDGDGTFTLASNPFNANDIHSFAVGDLNHDGFLDIYAGHGSGFNGTGSVRDELFMNNGNSNHFVAIQLEGTASNINGIGARLEAYGPWGKQIREVRSGEGYGVMNSFTQHFGLGTSTTLDSVIVRWPSGVVDKLVNLSVDQFNLVIEDDKLNANIVADRTEAFPAPALINFDGSSSNNPAGGSLTYAWDFGDGSVGSGANTGHTFAQAGTYKVKLTVTTTNSESDTDSLTIKIGDNIDDFPDLDYDDDNDGIPDSVENRIGSFTLQLDPFQIPDDGGSSTQNVDLSSYGVRLGQNVIVSDVIADGDLNGSSETFTLSFNAGSYTTPGLQTGEQCFESFIPVSPTVSQNVEVIDIGGGTLGITILGTTDPSVDDLTACVGAMYQMTLTVEYIADIDGDGIDNYLDLDSDNDGIWDVVEAGGTDANKDAFIDDLSNQGTLINPPNTDSDDYPDFADVESTNNLNDGSGPFDISATSFSYFDTNNDGQITSADTDGGVDGDNDGLDDLIDGNLAQKGAGVIGEEICIPGNSVARKWNEVLLEGIRKDYARPTMHARNLHHISAAMYDAWAVYDTTSLQYFLGNTLHGYTMPFSTPPAVADSLAAQKEAMSYAAYRLIRHRFENSPGKNHTLYLAFVVMQDLGYDPNNTSTDYLNGGPAELGNYIAEKVIAYGLQDQSNEANDYANTHYTPVNDFIEIEDPGNPNLTDPNRWQPIAFDVFIDQSGNVISGNVPEFLSPEWGSVNPFALKAGDKTTFNRDGNTYEVYHDPGVPPKLNTSSSTPESELYKEAFSMVATWSAHLDPADGVMWDISPASLGNIPLSELPTAFEDHDQFYDYLEGGVAGNGRTINPKTGAPYPAQNVPRGDYARVLAEFWADGPDSETPPGHWFTILNYVSDNPQLEKKWKGQGDLLSDLEWDIKSYFTLGGTMHDAAISAWGVKGWYDYIRPVSAIRYMASKGQSTNPGGVNYDPAGIPLVPGKIELIEAGDPLVGVGNENLGKIKIFGWKGPNFIANPDTDVAGVGWILADDWMPYQRPTFVTPPFAGYVSGHSTFSRAAAEVMTFMTGDEYFPGGVGEFLCKQDEFLVFEEGPSMDITLQWATYRDASDECSLSRIWGGIHPSLDDIPGRLMGKEIGDDGFAFSDSIFNEQQEVSVSVKTVLEGCYDTSTGLMDDYYITDGILGTTDPYGLNTTISSSVMALTGLDAVVDWIKLELRDANDSTIVVAEKAVLLQRNRSLIDAEGNSDISFSDLSASSFYVSIKHYNHLGVMSATAVDLSSGALLDFSSPLTLVYTFGGEAQREINGTMVLWAGDANGDGKVNAVDNNLFWKLQNGSPFIYGTTNSDFDLNGNINAIDINFYWRFNNSLIEQIPK